MVNWLYHQHLLMSRYGMKDLPCSGRPSMSFTEINIAKAKEIVTKNPNSNLIAIAAEFAVKPLIIQQ